MDRLSVMDTFSARRFGETIAGRAGLKMRYIQERTQPRTNPKTREIFVTTPRWDWTTEQFSIWMGELLHEIGHHWDVNADIMDYFVAKNTDMSSYYGVLANIFGDWVNDGQWLKRNLDGAHRYVEAAQKFHCERGINAIEKDGVKEDEKSKLMCSVFSWIYQRRADEFQEGLLAPALRWAKNVDASPLFQYNSDLSELHDGPSIEALIKKILTENDMEQEIPPDEPQKGEGEGGEGEEGDEDGKGKTPAKGSGEGNEEEGDSETEGWVSYKSLLAHDHAKVKENKGLGNGLEILYDHEPEYNYQPYNTYREYDLSKEDVDKCFLNQLHKECDPMINNSARLGKRIQKLILVKTTEDREVGCRSGRIHARSLYKVPSGGQDVFYRKTLPIVQKDAAIMFLGDISGSMASRNKIYSLAASLVLLNEACSKLNIPFEIVCFSETFLPEFFLVKKFGDRVQAETILERMSECMMHMGQNPDGEALLYAYKRLMVRHEKKKIMIVLSDGQPCSDAPGDAHTHLKRVSAELEKRIDLYGVGLMSDKVKDYYKHNCVVNHAEELEDTLLNIFKHKILG